MHQALLHLAAAVLAAAAFSPINAHAMPVLLADRHADSHSIFAGSEPVKAGAGVQPCLASEMDVLPLDRSGADDALAWLLITGGAALLAFARRPAARIRAKTPGP